MKGPKLDPTLTEIPPDIPVKLSPVETEIEPVDDSEELPEEIITLPLVLIDEADLMLFSPPIDDTDELPALVKDILPPSRKALPPAIIVTCPPSPPFPAVRLKSPPLSPEVPTESAINPEFPELTSPVSMIIPPDDLLAVPVLIETKPL